MNRRGFLGLSLAAVGGIFVPKYDKWYRQGSGLLVRDPEFMFTHSHMEMDAFDVESFDADGFTLSVRGKGKIAYTYRTGLFTPSLTAPVMLDAPRIVAYAV